MGNYKSTVKNDRKLIFVSVSMFFLEVSLIFLFFRKIRNFFPIPEIGNAKVVGYSQYFGYPLYFDTFMLFAILLSVPLITIFTTLFKKYFNR